MAAKTESPIAEINNPHDAFFKSLLGRRAMAAQFIRLYLPREATQALDLRTLERRETSFVSEELRRYFSDLIYRVKLKDGGDAYIYILLEHKSAPDKWAALQLLGYEVKLWEEAREGGADRLPLIIPVLVYHGRQRWNVGRDFRSLVTGAEREEWSRYVPQFEYYLCDLSLFDDDQIAGSPELRTGLMLMKYIFHPELRDHLGEILGGLRRLPEGTVKRNLKPIVKYVVSAPTGLESKQVAEAMNEALPKSTGGVMQTIAEGWLQEGIQKGIQKGLTQAREEARKKLASLALRQLKYKFGHLSERAEKRVSRLPSAQLELLADTILKFEKPADLNAWLREHDPRRKS